MVLPVYIEGTDVVQPTTRTSTRFISTPNLGTDVHVVFGGEPDRLGLG